MMPVQDVVQLLREQPMPEVTTERVREYLDGCIAFWRDVRDDPENRDEDRESALPDAHLAPVYIDAYQSARLSLLGSTLP